MNPASRGDFTFDVRVTDFAVLIASDTGVVPHWTGGTFDLEAA